MGDTAIYMPGIDVSDAAIAATRFSDPPRKYDNTLKPTPIKYFDSKRTTPDVVSIRPVVYRSAETYLIAARKPTSTDAVAMINAIRRRAAQISQIVLQWISRQDDLSQVYF
jgi:hypothetical protein